MVEREGPELAGSRGQAKACLQEREERRDGHGAKNKREHDDVGAGRVGIPWDSQAIREAERRSRIAIHLFGGARQRARPSAEGRVCLLEHLLSNRHPPIGVLREQLGRKNISCESARIRFKRGDLRGNPGH